MRQFFLTSAANYVLSDIVKNLPMSSNKYNVAFIPTASEVYNEDTQWVDNDRNALIKMGFNLKTEFSITGLKKEEIITKLENINLIFVCGGNPFYLLDQVIKSGFDEILKDKTNPDTIYIGSSAGSMIIGDHIDLVSTADEVSKALQLKSKGLKIIDLAILPHWGNQELYEEYKSEFNKFYIENIKIVPLTNYQYLKVINNNYEIIQV
ncbi:MAG TPA: Type 1 glutamine amidotransferase-like domain-containing protein [Candidatus Woesebacteria bacterium]|jgi:dipeptidase E|nr:Type 1 glutamine amidotransferase-like domain-containing protein [Candidatus Shapirobacteria bacterium]HOR02209.1 Type 1 glutamine amidotransferase-like domain-containing protein [Candidatus Woesebacteria bacterium]